jgi:acyl-CoA thioesterase-1
MLTTAIHTMEDPRLLPHKTLLQKAISAFFVTLVVTCALIFQGAENVARASENSANQPIRILAFGDSLTAGYGLDDPSAAFPARLEARLKEKGYQVEILQAGVSGDTTTGGRSRLEWSLADEPDAVIVALGGNDALRAVSPSVTADNMEFIVNRIQEEGLPVLIAGMLAPPNLGRDYGDRFNSIFPMVAEKTGALIYPFFLEGVAAEPDLNQDDGIHPNIEGVEIIVAGILPMVEKLISQVEEKRSGRQSASSSN